MVWDASDVSTGPLATGVGHSSFVRSVTYSSDGTRLVSGSWDNTIVVWDASDVGAGPIARGSGHSSSVYSVACSPDGFHIVSGSNDETIKLWQLNFVQKLSLVDVVISNCSASGATSYVVISGSAITPTLAAAWSPIRLMMRAQRTIEKEHKAGGMRLSASTGDLVGRAQATRPARVAVDLRRQTPLVAIYTGAEPSAVLEAAALPMLAPKNRSGLGARTDPLGLRLNQARAPLTLVRFCGPNARVVRTDVRAPHASSIRCSKPRPKTTHWSPTSGITWAVTKLHGAVKVQFLCAQREAGVSLNISAKFWRISSPD